MTDSAPLPRRSGPGQETMLRNYPLLLRRMEQLMEISRTLASTLDLSRLLRQIVEAVKELTATEAASLLLFDPRTGELRFEATTNLEAATMRGLVVPQSGSVAGWIVEHGEPLVVPDVSRDPRWSQVVDSKTAFATRSLMGVPLIARGKTLGVLEALNKCNDRPFTEEDVVTLQALAAQAAVAITNARLFQQSDIVAEMVHELRTPLAALTATTHLLLRPDLPDERRFDLIRTIQRETGRLSQMATDFLDMARLDSGRMRFTCEPCELSSLLDECVEIVRPQATARHLQIVTLYDEVPTLETDRGKLKQVVLNLLTNAVKYNRDNGSITVALVVDEAFARIGVSDTGNGIPPEARARLFERFYRASDSEVQASGTGLGLVIARKIVESLGGEMNVTSTVGVGSTFYFTLPLGRMPGK